MFNYDPCSLNYSVVQAVQFVLTLVQESSRQPNCSNYWVLVITRIIGEYFISFGVGNSVELLELPSNRGKWNKVDRSRGCKESWQEVSRPHEKLTQVLQMHGKSTDVDRKFCGRSLFTEDAMGARKVQSYQVSCPRRESHASRWFLKLSRLEWQFSLLRETVLCFTAKKTKETFNYICSCKLPQESDSQLH